MSEQPPQKPPTYEPWYYKPENRKRLYLPARALRNLALMLFYFTGIGWLLASQAALVMYLATPDTLAGLYARFPAAPWGAGAGFVLGLASALLYRIIAPQNRKAPRVVIPLLTGVGGLVGLGYALGGDALGQVAILFVTLGLASYFYIEGYPTESGESGSSEG